MTYVLIAVFSLWMAELSWLPQTLMEWLCKKGLVYKIEPHFEKRIPRRCLPFDCTKCLAFWIALIFGILDNPPTAILWAGATSYAAVSVGLITNKYLKE